MIDINGIYEATIPNEFTKDVTFDSYHRKILFVYVLKSDNKYIRTRLACISAGNIFRISDINIGDDDIEDSAFSSDSVLYIAVEDARYIKKDNRVYVKAADYNEINKDYKSYKNDSVWKPEKDSWASDTLCRGKYADKGTITPPTV